MKRLPVALVGIGKIARDRHIPALADSPDFRLAATVSRHGSVPGVPAYTDFAAFLAERPDIPVVSLCLPPQPRFAYAAAALQAGRHVMLEKPPGQTVAEVQALHGLAQARGLTLFATWHSRMSPAVMPARDWLASRSITRGRITWHEDVRHWHPGQDWVFEPGGMGVFDPGINALSILTAILPAPLHLVSADLEVPANRQTPIAARLVFSGDIIADFDWRQTGAPRWDIAIDTPDGQLVMERGGRRMTLDGHVLAEGESRQYPALYTRMADLVAKRACEVDLSPMVHVADAMTLGRRRVTDAFHF